jgi:hypothetical protein
MIKNLNIKSSSSSPNFNIRKSKSYLNNNEMINRQQQTFYEPYWNLKDVEEALAAKLLIKSKLRINTRNYKDAYLSDPNDTTQIDVFIEDTKNRNRALHGDIVGAKYKEKFEWKILDNFKQNVKSYLLSH